MALRSVNSKSLLLIDGYKSSDAAKREKKKNVLDEETYTENIEEIITRDFFPELPSLYSQAEYFEALQKNDLAKLRQIQMKYRQSTQRPGTEESSVYNSPATFETPDLSAQKSSPDVRSKSCEETTPADATNTNHQQQEEKKSGLSLDQYLAKTTSEDNASFDEILKDGEKRHRDKHAWMYDKEGQQSKEHEDKLALPSIEAQAAIEQNKASVDTWKYKPNNALMYVPDGVELSAKELIEMKKHKPREIIHENTRFQYNPHNVEKNKQLMEQAASFKAMTNIGKIGHDGKEIVVMPSPSVNGYGFVGTPSPAPGVDESPLMTWGEIEGTPFRLDGNQTPISTTPGPVFKIPNIPQRDQLALELAEKASRGHRAKKQEAIKQVTRNLASPKLGRSTTERLNSMSPAAQRLASRHLGIKTHTDKALRDSYTPSPVHRLPGDKTPILRTTPGNTPSSLVGTPGSTSSTPKRDSEVVSLTDNLLQLPTTKRMRAADFFDS